MNSGRGSGTEGAERRLVTVAAAQFAPVHGDVRANLDVIGSLLELGSARGADLVVFPELATTGYAWASADKVAPFAEPVPGPVTDWLTARCREYGCHVVLGLAERGGPLAVPGSRAADTTPSAARRPLYNTAVLVGPDGLIGRYRKTKLWSWDTLWATAGDQPPPVWPTPVGNVGMLICADMDYPEGTSWLARSGADIVAAPTCWSEEPAPSPVWRARAHDGGVPFAVANVSGTEWGTTFAAGSCVIGETGGLLDHVGDGDGEGLAVAAVDLAAGRRRRRERATRAPDAMSAAYEALDRNAQLFPSVQVPRPGGRSRSAGIVVVQGPAGGDAEADLASLTTLLAGERPTLVVLPTLIAPDLAADPGLLARLALACHRYPPAEFVLSVLDERTGHTSVLLAADGAIVTSFQVSPGGVRTGEGAPLRPVVRPWGSVGLLAAAELLRPEPGRCLAINGSDLIAATGRLPDPPAEAASGGTAAVRGTVPPFNLWRVRAGENNCYLAVANATFPGGRGGRSALQGPDYYDHRAARVTLNSTDERAVALRITLDPATSAGRLAVDKPLLAQRRPDLYTRPA